MGDNKLLALVQLFHHVELLKNKNQRVRARSKQQQVLFWDLVEDMPDYMCVSELELFMERRDKSLRGPFK